MLRLTRKEMQQQTRERLLAAARKEIVSKGINGAPVRDIAEAAGYSMGAFYSNFESKEAVLEDLIKVHMQEEMRLFREITEKAAAQSKPEVLNQISLWLKGLVENRSLSALTFEFEMHASRSPSFRKKFNSVKAQRLQDFAEGLRTLFAINGLEPKMDCLQMAIGLAALWNGFAMQGTVPGAKEANEVIFVFLKALLESATPVESTNEAI